MVEVYIKYPLKGENLKFDAQAFEKALEKFLQFELSLDAVTCNGNSGGFQALLTFIDSLPSKEGIYELPQWPHERWRWKTPEIEREESVSYDPIPYISFPPNLETPRNQIAKKVFLYLQYDHEKIYLQLQAQSDEIHIYVNKKGLIDFKNILKTSMSKRNWFFVVKPNPICPKNVEFYPKVCLTGAWGDGSIDVFECICHVPQKQKWLDFKSSNISGNSSGYIWLIRQVIDFCKSLDVKRVLNIPYEDGPKPTHKWSVEYDTAQHLMTFSNGFSNVHETIDDEVHRLISESNIYSHYLHLVKLPVKISEHVIWDSGCKSDYILEANQAGWDAFCAFLERALFSKIQHEHLETCYPSDLQKFLANPTSQKLCNTSHGPSAYGSYYHDKQFMMQFDQEFEPISGLPLKTIEIPRHEYVKAHTLIELP